MKKKAYTQGGDAQAIARIASSRFRGDYTALFEYHGWPERGQKMMCKVQTRVAETYGSVKAFEEHFVQTDPSVQDTPSAARPVQMVEGTGNSGNSPSRRSPSGR